MMPSFLYFSPIGYTEGKSQGAKST
uniref:Uncharacterized protein n=1 Tax=Anguilla anguilla TaxID=7936 RepID=A0A0E9STU9_ANGAN